MQKEIYKKIKRAIDNRLYTISDVMTCEFEFQGFHMKKHETDYKPTLKKYVLQPVKDILSAGELPHINPDFEQYSTDRRIEDEKLLEYIDKNAYYVLSELDKNKYHMSCHVCLKMIFLNLGFLDDEKLELISHMKIKSFMGESELGESKKIQV